MRLYLAHILIRIGVATTLFYGAVAAFLAPSSWVGYLPDFALFFGPAEVLLGVWGIAEVALGVWIVSGWRIQIPAAITALSLMLVIAFNINQMSVLFRDIGVAFAALALVLLPSNDDQSTA